MNIEKKRIEMWGTGDGTIGHITLNKLAIPETVKVRLGGEEIIPSSFNAFGHPNFTQEQAMIFMFKEDAFRRKRGKKERLEAEVTYEEEHFDVPRSSFDTVEGIKKSLGSLSAIDEMLTNRAKFRMARGAYLNEFMLFGCFRLDEFAQVWSIERKSKKEITVTADVELFEEFSERNKSKLIGFTSDEYCIPKPGSVCPCCGKEITLDDIKSNPCVYKKGKFYHDSCDREYRRLSEIDRLTRCLMDMVYDSSEYWFKLLPNGYCSKECCSHIPWIEFCTPDGNIVVGWRKRVISIEWQENYKQFDMEELFGQEGVTKWEKGGKRGIHAWGSEKAYEYLKKVKDAVQAK